MKKQTNKFSTKFINQNFRIKVFGHTEDGQKIEKQLESVNDYALEVIDFIDFCGIWNAIFNGADSFVCVGAGLLILSLVIDIIKESKAEREKKLAAQTEGGESKGNNENDTDGN